MLGSSNRSLPINRRTLFAIPLAYQWRNQTPGERRGATLMAAVQREEIATVERVHGGRVRGAGRRRDAAG
jgi:hypothetical protein